jgi:hypothetical protein
MDHTRQRIDAMASPLLQTSCQSERVETHINQRSETCGTRAKAQRKTSREDYTEAGQNQSKVEGGSKIEVQHEVATSNGSPQPDTG